MALISSGSAPLCRPSASGGPHPPRTPRGARPGRQLDGVPATVEALPEIVAATARRAQVFLDGGIEPARRLIESTFAPDIEAIDKEDLLFHDYKTALQELAQGRGLPLPDYNVVAEVGPDHDKTFIVEVKMGRIVARGTHEELMETSELYTEIYNSQLVGDATPEPVAVA